MRFDGMELNRPKRAAGYEDDGRRGTRIAADRTRGGKQLSHLRGRREVVDFT